MDFTLSKEHEMARALFKEFAEKEVKPLAQEVDETEVFPRETVEKMAKLGFLGIPVPKEYGDRAVILSHTLCAWRSSLKYAEQQALSYPHIPLCAATRL